ncbi:MAG TPA: DUF6702 family protein [Cyclobacteriaceae bacterium]|nr:DUF6702 family protein [Cyclobacteriaceae bacterium]
MGISKLKAKIGLLAILSAALVFAPCGTAHSRHPIHVSVAEIDYDPAEKELEIMIRIFIDDLENALRRYHGQDNIDILNPGQTSPDKLIDAYLQENFIVSIDNRRQRTRYLGQEVEGQALICYILIPGIGSWKECEVTNSILQEIFDDQSNIVHVTQNDVTKSQRLMRRNPTGKFSF